MDLHSKLLIIFLLLIANIVWAQTGSINVDENHNGHKIFGLPTPTAGNEAATKAYADSVGGGGGGSVSLTATSPIIVTPSPITGTGVVSLDSTSKTNWDLAFTQTRQWDGGATGLVAATGRTSLGLVIGTNVQGYDADLDALAALSGTHNIYYRSASNTWSSVTIGTGLDFTGATLSATAGGTGNVSTTGSPLDNQVAVFTDATHVEGNSNLSFDSSTNILSTVIVSPTTGFRINGAAANRRILVGNATNFVQSTETYAVPGTSGNVMQSDGTNWTSAQLNFSALSGNWTLAQGPSTTAAKLIGRTDASAGIPQEITLGTNLAMSGTTLNASGGGSVSITATSPIVVTPTPLTGTGVVSLNAGVDLALTTAQNVTLTDAVTAAISEVLTLTHNSSGAPSSGFGTGLMFQGKSDTTNGRAMGEIAANWSTSTDGSRVSYLRFRGAGSSGLSSTQIYMFNSGGISAGSSTDPGASVIAGAGFKINSVAATSGSILQGDGNKYVGSTPTWPTSSTAAGRIIRGNGTNFSESTATWPDTSGTAGYTVRSDGTNFASYPQDVLNSSVASQSPSTSDVYVTGSNVVVAAGDFKVKGQYRCLFDVTKSAGTGGIVISVRTGTTGTVASDTANLTFTFPAGTSVADVGTFEVLVNWRTVGSGTSAVVEGVCRAQKNTVTAAGLWGDTSAAKTIVATVSSGFASNTFTNMGVSFNGGTAFAGTITTVQASLLQ